jgi:formate hydrogenlyase subunit 4
MTSSPDSPSFSKLDWKRQNPPKSPGFDWEMYRYVPSLAGAIICIIVFFAMAVLHLNKFLRSKNRIIVFLVIGALCTFEFKNNSRDKQKHDN